MTKDILARKPGSNGVSQVRGDLAQGEPVAIFKEATINSPDTFTNQQPVFTKQAHVPKNRATLVTGLGQARTPGFFIQHALKDVEGDIKIIHLHKVHHVKSPRRVRKGERWLGGERLQEVMLEFTPLAGIRSHAPKSLQQGARVRDDEKAFGIWRARALEDFQAVSSAEFAHILNHRDGRLAGAVDFFDGLPRNGERLIHWQSLKGLEELKADGGFPVASVAGEDDVAALGS